MRMPAQDNYHVVAIDFSPHSESMQTDALLGARSASGVPVSKSGAKNMAGCVFCVGVAVVVIMIIVANL